MSDFPYGYDSINGLADHNKFMMEQKAAQREADDVHFAKILKMVHEKLASHNDSLLDPDSIEIEDKPNAKYDPKFFEFNVATVVGPRVDRGKCKNCGKPLTLVDGGFDICLDCRRKAKHAYED